MNNTIVSIDSNKRGLDDHHGFGAHATQVDRHSHMQAQANTQIPHVHAQVPAMTIGKVDSLEEYRRMQRLRFHHNHINHRHAGRDGVGGAADTFDGATGASDGSFPKTAVYMSPQRYHDAMRVSLQRDIPNNNVFDITKPPSLSQPMQPRLVVDWFDTSDENGLGASEGPKLSSVALQQLMEARKRHAANYERRMREEGD